MLVCLQWHFSVTRHGGWVLASFACDFYSHWSLEGCTFGLNFHFIQLHVPCHNECNSTLCKSIHSLCRCNCCTTKNLVVPYRLDVAENTSSGTLIWRQLSSVRLVCPLLWSFSWWQEPENCFWPIRSEVFGIFWWFMYHLICPSLVSFS